LRYLASLFLLLTTFSAAPVARSQTQFPPPSFASPERIIIDTDIGDDIDDAFAIALALRSPELQILGISTTFGDTEARARILDRLLGENARRDIPVLAGTATQTKNPMSQRVYGDAARFTRAFHPAAMDFILEQIRNNPGQITLVAIGPLINIGALLDRDPQTFLKLKRVVLMGGSVHCGYSEVGLCPGPPPVPEWNILNDIPSAQKLFRSGVPLYVMPLDSTQLKFNESMRSYVFRQGTPLTDALTLLYHEWNQPTPTLFDPMTIAYILNPQICPTEPMHITVDEKGFTRPESGTPNAQVCLHSDSDAFFHLLLTRLVPSPKSVSP